MNCTGVIDLIFAGIEDTVGAAVKEAHFRVYSYHSQSHGQHNSPFTGLLLPFIRLVCITDYSV